MVLLPGYAGLTGLRKRDFVLGRQFTSLEDLNGQVHRWLERVNSTVHGTTYQIPLERFKVGNKYSVPYRFAGRTAELHILEGKLEIYVDHEKVCEHEILPGNCRVSKKKEHFQGLLSEILKENSKCKKASQIPLKFSGPEVEKRSLDVYETFSEGGFE
ncbi:Mobile element protein [Methanosarcina mazei Tuc01]|uniref:Mobile element protein n=1 Tax=Methanosarcina mazei Tuc01 TaxID=1236903 RepID=M1Q6V2_METMZ|nr:Mobile element protein [Methanosarcina mazei Tuc01]